MQAKCLPVAVYSGLSSATASKILRSWWVRAMIRAA